MNTPPARSIPLAHRLAPDQREGLLAGIVAGKSLHTLSLQAGMPVEAILRAVVEADSELREAVRLARQAAADRMAEECVTIADAASDHPDDVAHRRLRIETRQKLARAWGPGTYGDTSRHVLAGDASAPIMLSDAERAARIAAILASATPAPDAPALPMPQPQQGAD